MCHNLPNPRTNHQKRHEVTALNSLGTGRMFEPCALARTTKFWLLPPMVSKSNFLLVASNPSSRFLEIMELENNRMYSHYGMWIRDLQYIPAW